MGGRDGLWASCQCVCVSVHDAGASLGAAVLERGPGSAGVTQGF